MSTQLSTVNQSKLFDTQALIDMTLNKYTSQATKKAYTSQLNMFFVWYAVNGEGMLTPDQINRYKNHLLDSGKSVAFTQQAIAAIRSMVDCAYQNGLLPADVKTRIMDFAKPPKGSNAKVTKGRALKLQEFSAMLTVCGHNAKGIRDKAIMSVMYCSGIRRGSLVNLDLSDYRPEEGVLHIREAKGGKTFDTALHPDLIPYVEEWLKIRGREPGPMFYSITKGMNLTDRRISSQAIYNLVVEYSKKAGIKAFSPHSFRRTYVTNLLQAGIPINLVSKSVGHSSVSVTARYDMSGLEEMKKGISKLAVPEMVGA